MRFFSDNDLEIDVRWYPAPSGAKWFPTWQRFGNGDLASVRANWDGPGQVLDTRKYVSNPTAPPNVTGQFFLGSIDQYQGGTIYPGVPLNCLADGQCPGCGAIVDPVTTCVQAGPWNNSDLTLRIVAVDNPASPPVGNVGDSYTFVNLGPGNWNTANTPVYAPTGNQADLGVGCDFTPSPPLFSLEAGIFSGPFGGSIPWLTVIPITLTGGKLVITWGWIPQALSNFMCSEVWTMELTL